MFVIGIRAVPGMFRDLPINEVVKRYGRKTRLAGNLNVTKRAECEARHTSKCFCAFAHQGHNVISPCRSSKGPASVGWKPSCTDTKVNCCCGKVIPTPPRSSIAKPYALP